MRNKEFSGLFYAAAKACKGKPPAGAFQIQMWDSLISRVEQRSFVFLFLAYLFLIVLSMLIHAERLAEVSAVGEQFYFQPA